MKVLVTGGAGFIGSHVVDRLVAAGYRVFVLDNLSTGRLANLNPKAEFFQIDLTDYAAVREMLKAVQPDYVIHHAAQVDVTTSLSKPLHDAQVNILGSINLFQEAFRVGARRIVYASSAAIYGNPVRLPLKEEDAIVPLAPYGISKYTPEHYLRILAREAGSGYTILRYANVYGPRQSATGEGGVVAIFAHRLAAGEQPVIFGDGEQTRDFVYVEDVARANLVALETGVDDTFNISTGSRISVNELVRAFEKVIKRSITPRYEKPRPGEILHSALDPSKAREVLGWQAETDLLTGLKRTHASLEPGL
ncbi:MAG: SDR family NAD(P)-dependent oxidoreductase [Firmicutes bacterium]|nr:SDR family NAD(P)-dependent oxidoreductase [Bacillota bacterium]